MAEATITIPFEEFQASPTESIGEQGFAATRTLRCAWADRLTLADQLLGAFSDGMGGYTYALPHLYPHRNGTRCLAVPNIVGHDDDRPMPDGVDTSVATYTKALLTVNYGRAQQAQTEEGDSTELADESLSPFAEFTTLSPAGLTWGSSSGPALEPEEAPGKLFKGFQWEFTRMNVASIPAAVESLVGCVNSASITSPQLGFTFAAETLLYNPPILSRKLLSDSVTSRWTIRLKFSYKKQGWNKYWRAATNSFEAIYKGATQVKPYPTGDFTTLILPS